MKTALLPSILIAVSAFLFTAAYLVVQFVGEHLRRTERKAWEAAEAARTEAGQAPKRPSHKYRRSNEAVPLSSRRKTRR